MVVRSALPQVFSAGTCRVPRLHRINKSYLFALFDGNKYLLIPTAPYWKAAPSMGNDSTQACREVGDETSVETTIAPRRDAVSWPRMAWNFVENLIRLSLSSFSAKNYKTGFYQVRLACKPWLRTQCGFAIRQDGDPKLQREAPTTETVAKGV